MPAAVGAVIAAVAVRIVQAGGGRNISWPTLDAGGALLLTTGALALVYGLGSPPRRVELSRDAGATRRGSPALGLFAVRERRHAQPLVPPALFAIKGLIRTNVSMFMFGSYVAFQFILTLYCQNALGWSALEAGLAFLLGGVLTAVLAARGAGAVIRHGPWPVTTAGAWFCCRPGT